MSSENKLDELHRVETELLAETVKLFEKHDIKYYAIGGTLLGAIRHGGFIPWDDDIDLAVPREEYVRLIEIMRHEENPIVGMKYYRDEPQLYYYPMRLVHKGYITDDPRDVTGKCNPWIDVFPIDGWTEGKIGGRIFKAKMMTYRLLLALHYSDNLRDIKRSKIERIIIKTAQITHIGKLINPTKVKDKIDKTLSANKISKCHIVGTCMGAYFFHEFVPRSYFGEGTTVTFEGIEVKAPVKVHKYLTHMYGNYMELPPEDKRIIHVSGEITKVE